MKKIFLVSFMVMFAMAMSVSAQDNQNGERRGGGQGQGAARQAQRYEQLKKDLSLNDKQVDSLKVIDTERMTQMRDLREKVGDDREKMATEMKKVTDKSNARVKKVLTADQYKKYVDAQEKAAAERRERGGQGGQGRRGGQGGGPPRQN